MSKDNTELKPCPFCDGRTELQANGAVKGGWIAVHYGYGQCPLNRKYIHPTAWNTRHTPTDGLAGELAELIEKASPGDLKSAEGHTSGGLIECPLCGGDGELEEDGHYQNFDGLALGVQFYGIGQAFGAHEKLWVWFTKHRHEILTALQSQPVVSHATVAGDTQNSLSLTDGQQAQSSSAYAPERTGNDT